MRQKFNWAGDEVKWCLGMVFLLVFFLPSYVRAGEIYGRISGPDIREGLTVTVKALSTDRVYTTPIGNDGSFSIYIYETGSCMLTLDLPDRPSIYVTSGDRPVSYDLTIIIDQNRRHVLRRE